MSSSRTVPCYNKSLLESLLKSVPFFFRFSAHRPRETVCVRRYYLCMNTYRGYAERDSNTKNKTKKHHQQQQQQQQITSVGSRR